LHGGALCRGKEFSIGVKNTLVKQKRKGKRKKEKLSHSPKFRKRGVRTEREPSRTLKKENRAPGISIEKNKRGKLRGELLTMQS